MAGFGHSPVPTACWSKRIGKARISAHWRVSSNGRKRTPKTQGRRKQWSGATSPVRKPSYSEQRKDVAGRATKEAEQAKEDLAEISMEPGAALQFVSGGTPRNGPHIQNFGKQTARMDHADWLRHARHRLPHHRRFCAFGRRGFRCASAGPTRRIGAFVSKTVGRLFVVESCSRAHVLCRLASAASDLGRRWAWGQPVWL